MKKGILLGFLVIGIGSPALKGATLTEALDEILILADKAPNAADQIKANLNTMKNAIKAKQAVNAIKAAEQILLYTAQVVGPTSNLLAALGDISLIKRRIPQISSGTSKIRDLSQSLKETSNQFSELVELVDVLR